MLYFTIGQIVLNGSPFHISILCSYPVGIEVNYRGEVAGIQPGPAVIRCIILCWVGDHPAQCEVGKFFGSGGVHACRRDKVKGMCTCGSKYHVVHR